MKYVQPWGEVDEDAPYINGAPEVGRMGSIPPGEVFEHTMREMVAVIDRNEVIPDEEDLQQFAKAIRSQRMNYGEDTGSVNTMSVAFIPPIEEYTVGLPIRVKVMETNTGPVSIDAGAGRVYVHRMNGADLTEGDLRAAGIAELVFDGTAFQLINFGGNALAEAEGGGGGPEQVSIYVMKIPYCVATGTANAIIANFPPETPITTYGPGGLIVMIKASNTNTGPTTININGLGPKEVSAVGGTPGLPFLPSDIQVGDVIIATYDGVRFWVVPNPSLSVSTVFPVTTNAQFDLVFNALARKRIYPPATVTVKMAAGLWQPIATYHADSKQIIVEGTMIGLNPTVANFARTGSSAAARAADAAANIVMLRARYGTEIYITNAQLQTTMAGMRHRGPGAITFKDILVTGENTTNTVGLGAGCTGPNMIVRGCTVWGCGSGSFFVYNSGSVICYDSFSSSCQSYGAAFGGTTGGAISCQRCGAFGGLLDGFGCTSQCSVFLFSDCYSQGNGTFGVFGNVGGFIWIGDRCVLSGNAQFDAYAWANSTILTAASATVGTASPPLGVVGNYESVNAGGG